MSPRCISRKWLVYKTKFPTSKAGNGFPACGPPLGKPFPENCLLSNRGNSYLQCGSPGAYIFKGLFKSLRSIPVYCLGENLTAPIKNLYARPKQVGQDRLVNAYAASRLYGAPLVVIDFGTAVTLDVISKTGSIWEG